MDAARSSPHGCDGHGAAELPSACSRQGAQSCERYDPRCGGGLQPIRISRGTTRRPRSVGPTYRQPRCPREAGEGHRISMRSVMASILIRKQILRNSREVMLTGSGQAAAIIREPRTDCVPLDKGHYYYFSSRGYIRSKEKWVDSVRAEVEQIISLEGPRRLGPEPP